MATSKDTKGSKGKAPSGGSKNSRSSGKRTIGKETKGTTIGDVVKSEVPVAPEVERVTASKIEPTVEVAKTKIDTTEADIWRDRQKNLATDLENTAYGRSPSLADLQFQKATEQNVAQQFALARSQRASNNPALALRQAQTNAAQVAQTAAMDSAIARIQEQRSAQNMLNQVLGTGRAQDVQLGIAQGEITNKESLANALAANDRFREQAKLDQAAGLANSLAANNRGDLGYNASVNAAQQYADAMNQRRLQQANINSQIEQQRISAGATTGAARIAAGAQDRATDAGLLKFNIENALGLDQQMYGNRMNEAGQENTRNQNRNAGLRDGIGQAGNAMTALASSGAGGK